MNGTALLAQAGCVAVYSFVTCHRVDAGSHRTVFGDAIPHQLEVVSPTDAVERREVHQDLAVYSQDVEQADVGGGQSLDLLAGQLISGQRALRVAAVFVLYGGVSVELVQELLEPSRFCGMGLLGSVASG